MGYTDSRFAIIRYSFTIDTPLTKLSLKISENKKTKVPLSQYFAPLFIESHNTMKMILIRIRYLVQTKEQFSSFLSSILLFPSFFGILNNSIRREVTLPSLVSLS